MQRVQTLLHWMIVVSASSHIFCCVLPTLISTIGLMTGLGMLSGFLPWFEQAHETMHALETPLLVFSGVTLAFGWSAQVYSNKIDCHDTGCHHAPCAPKKKRAALILKGATALFSLNLMTLLFFVH